MAMLLKFIEGNFSKLPPWARVFVYLVMTALFVYLTLAPRFINGQIVAKTTNGGFVPYRGVEMQTRIDGRTMKFQTAEDGSWSIPVISRWPEGVVIQIFHKDAQAWFEARIEAADIWTKIWNNEFRLIVARQPPSISVESVAQAWVPMIASGFARDAHAGELQLPEGVATNTKANRDLRKSVDEDVKKIYAQVTRKPITQWEKVNISEESGLSYVERIELIATIEKKQGVKIPDEHWKALRTLGELADYLYKRKTLEAHDPKYRIEQSSDWANIEANAPPKERPRFREN